MASGNYFSYGPESAPLHILASAIVPVKNIYQVGVAITGGCRLEVDHTECAINNATNKEYSVSNEFCHRGFTITPNLNSKVHNFDEIVTETDFFNIDDSMGEVYRFENYQKSTYIASIEALSTTNEYSANFFPNVKHDLKSRFLWANNLSHVVVNCPVISRQDTKVETQKWISLFTAEETYYFTAQMYPEERYYHLVSDNTVVPLKKVFSHHWENNNVSNFIFVIDDSVIKREISVKYDKYDNSDVTEGLLNGYMNIVSYNYNIGVNNSNSIETTDTDDSIFRLNDIINFVISILPFYVNRQPDTRFVELPDFTFPLSDFIFGSIIERESSTYNLYISTFFMSRYMFIPRDGDTEATVETIHPMTEGRNMLIMLS